MAIEWNTSFSFISLIHKNENHWTPPYSSIGLKRNSNRFFFTEVSLRPHSYGCGLRRRTLYSFVPCVGTRDWRKEHTEHTIVRKWWRVNQVLSSLCLSAYLCVCVSDMSVINTVFVKQLETNWVGNLLRFRCVLPSPPSLLHQTCDIQIKSIHSLSFPPPSPWNRHVSEIANISIPFSHRLVCQHLPKMKRFQLCPHLNRNLNYFGNRSGRDFAIKSAPFDANSPVYLPFFSVRARTAHTPQKCIHSSLFHVCVCAVCLCVGGEYLQPNETT